MKIQNTIFNPDGTRTIETIEVPEDFFNSLAIPPTGSEQLRADVDFLAAMAGVSL